MEIAAAAWTFVKGAFTAVSAGSATFAQTATVFAIKAAGVAALSAASAALMKPDAGARAPGEWVADPNAGIPFAIGARIGVAGNIVYKNTYGKDNEYKSIVTVLSGAGPITDYIKFTADRAELTFSAGEAVGQYEDAMWMQTRDGDQPDTALTAPSFGSYTLPSWTSAHKLSGKAAFMWTLKQDSKFSTYPQGEPAPVWVLEGIKGYDPRYDSTYPGGSGSCRLNDRSTYITITNPIIADLNWCLGLKENGKTVGGLGAGIASIDVDAFIEAANVADANDWTIACLPRSDESKSEVRAAMLQAGGALISRRAGLISCVTRGAVKASVATITVADTAGPIEIETAANVLNRVNTIVPRYLSEEHDWQLVAAAPVSSSDYVDEDRGRVRSDSRDYPYVPSSQQAAQLAALDIAHSREGIAGTIPLKPYCREIRPGDAFVIDGPGFVAENLKCLCLQRDYDPESDIVSLTFVSETGGKIAWALGQTDSPPPTPALSSVNRAVVAAPEVGAWSASGGTVGSTGATIPAVIVTGQVDQAYAQQVIVEYRKSGDDAWIPFTEGPATSERFEVTGIESGQEYEVALSYRTIFGVLGSRRVFGPVLVGSYRADEFAGEVDTEQLATGAVNQFTSTYAAGNIVFDESDGWVTVATIVLTTIADEAVDLDGMFSYSGETPKSSQTTMNAAWFKNGVQMAGQSTTNSVDMGVDPGAGRHVMPGGQMVAKINDAPGAVTTTYTLRVSAITAATYDGVASRRYARALTLKKPG